MTAPVACQWFATCTNTTTSALVHPILGEVPCCTRCAMRVEAFDSLVEIGASVTVDSQNSMGSDMTSDDWDNADPDEERAETLAEERAERLAEGEPDDRDGAPYHYGY